MASSPEKRHGCGLMFAFLGRRTRSRRRSSSTGSIPKIDSELVKPQSTMTYQRRSVSEEPTFSTKRSEPQQRAAIVKTVNLKPSCQPKETVGKHQGYVTQGRKLPREAIGISGELEMMIADHQKAKGSGKMIRASSGNVMLYGNLGNLRQRPGGVNANSTADGRVQTNGGTGNVAVKKPAAEEKRTGGLCRALSTRMDPETLKIMGNEDYKNGNFAEALALYEAAIAIDPEKASYRSNKSAALTALGRILEAVFECREAIRIDPRYDRAHHRLANLYIRLGEVEKAIHHYKQAGPEADGEDMARANALQKHVNECSEAKTRRDWSTLIKETHDTISAGANSAPQIYALRAEAYLRQYKHEEANKELAKAPNFSIDDCTKFFGPIGNANLLVVRSQVDMAVGRFDEALSAIEKAVRLDPNNREAAKTMRKLKAVVAARSKGNDLFKAKKCNEACVAYGEGLDHDPFNSVLLCNRAACRSKLQHYEKAVEDCTCALNLRPGYRKARLRRADCNAKLEKWEVAVRDYEMLYKETPEDEEVNKGLVEARSKLRNNAG